MSKKVTKGLTVLTPETDCVQKEMDLPPVESSVSSSSSVPYSPLLPSNFSPSRSIFGYSHTAPASRLEQIITPPRLRATYTLTLRLSRTYLPHRLSVQRLIWSAHWHFSVLKRCAISATLVFSRITSFRIRSRKVFLIAKLF
jgi:hypothetical protein